MCSVHITLDMSFPPKRESRASGVLLPLDSRFGGNDEVDGSCEGIVCHNVTVLNLTSRSHPNED
jgi:hypothetical protein